MRNPIHLINNSLSTVPKHTPSGVQSGEEIFTTNTVRADKVAERKQHSNVINVFNEMAGWPTPAIVCLVGTLIG